MATNRNPIFLNSVASNNADIVNADGTTQENIFTAGADGGAITNMVATTDDTSEVTVVIKSNDGTTTTILGEVKVPAGSGTNGAAPSVNLLDSVKMPGLFQADGSLAVGANASITVGAKSAVTAAKTLYISSVGGQYAA